MPVNRIVPIVGTLFLLASIAVIPCGCSVEDTKAEAMIVGSRKFLRLLPQSRRDAIKKDSSSGAESATGGAPAVAQPGTPAGTPAAPPGGAGAASPAATVEDVKKAFADLYENKISENKRATIVKEEIDRLHADRYGWLTRTTAAVVFEPKLRAAQPALIQSFSLRNFFQMLSKNGDPDFVQHKVEEDIATLKNIEKDPDSSAEEVRKTKDKYKKVQGEERDLLTKNLGKLTVEEYELLLASITDEAMKERWWFHRTNIPSIDLGLAAYTIGTSGDKFDSEVDKDFPQFLFGGGLHFGGFEVSAGAMLYRNPRDDFQVTPYFGFSIELYQTLLNSKPRAESATTSNSTSEPTPGPVPEG